MLSNTECSRIDHRAQPKRLGAFEEEQPKVGPTGEMSGSERVKEHREENEVLQQVQIGRQQKRFLYQIANTLFSVVN
jgi:hypothetical protein